jgi:hypothetical protein
MNHDGADMDGRHETSPAGILRERLSSPRPGPGRTRQAFDALRSLERTTHPALAVVLRETPLGPL